MLKHKHLRHLAYFVEIVRAGSIRNAAVKAKLSAAEAALEAGNDAASITSGQLRISIASELTYTNLPTIIRSFENAFSGTRVLVSTAANDGDRRQADVELKIVADYRGHGDDPKDVIASLPLELVCAPHLLASHSSAKLHEIISRIGLIGSATFANRWDFIYATPVRPGQSEPLTMRFDSKLNVEGMAAAHRMALEGLGAALLLSSLVLKEIEDGRLVRVSSDYNFGFLDVSVVMRDDHPSRLAKAFKEHLFSHHLQ